MITIVFSDGSISATGQVFGYKDDRAAKQALWLMRYGCERTRAELEAKAMELARSLRAAEAKGRC